MIVDTDNYAKGVEGAVAEMERSGYEVVERSNKWVDGEPYAGYHTLVRSDNGEVFELQFHTPESFDVKEGELHEIYERDRNLPRPNSAAFQSMSPEQQQQVIAEKNANAEASWAAAAKIPVPPIVERLPSTDDYTPPKAGQRVGPRPQRKPRRKLSRTAGVGE
jgi:hypothetical protein